MMDQNNTYNNNENMNNESGTVQNNNENLNNTTPNENTNTQMNGAGWTAYESTASENTSSSDNVNQTANTTSDYTQPQNNASQPNAGSDNQWDYASYDTYRAYTNPNANSEAGTNQYNASQPNTNPPKKPSGKKGGKVVLSIAGGVLAVAVLGFSVFGVYSAFFNKGIVSNMLNNNTTENQSSSSQVDPNLPSLNINDTPESEQTTSADGILATEQIAEKVKPSVVGVVQYQYNSQSIAASGEGSGVIMTSDGYIITNAHVIEDASGIKVVLNNGEEYEARIVGSDTRTDLAVIKIDAENLTAAEFGDSDALKDGQKVVAIGNPGGLTFAGSVTQGIISGTNRIVSSDYGDMEYIQTDAAINPGNSGGALVNEYGQVIGINSAKISDTDYEGIGFAIPMNSAKPIIDDLIQNGRVTGRVMLGIYNPIDVDEIAARVYGVPTGVQITSTDPNSDLAQKGVIAGDIITAINGTAISSTSDIRNIIDDFKVGDSVTLSVYRRTQQGDKTFDVSVTLMEDTTTSSTVQQTPQVQG